jgi:glycine cleavage system aminomethyltransferase T
MGLVCAEESLTRDDKLLDSDKEIGFVSAGAWSPTLEKGIGLIRLNESRPENYKLKVVTGSGSFDAKVVELPFFDKEKLLTK